VKCVKKPFCIGCDANQSEAEPGDSIHAWVRRYGCTAWVFSSRQLPKIHLPTDSFGFTHGKSLAWVKLRRWGLQGDLFLGNAECLPFADSSFDVVFHVGGINFFNDRAKAIREMIRVAKPGSRILIADETEEHVKDMYERGPITSGYYKNRKEPVTAPIDLVPPEMLETHLELLKPMGKNRFYALTFRKPGVNSEPVKPEMLAVETGR